MRIIRTFLDVFRRKNLTAHEEAVRIVKRMGYRDNGSGYYFKYSDSGTTKATFQVNGIKIKVYGFGYAESDFIPWEKVTRENLIDFIRYNQL